MNNEIKSTVPKPFIFVLMPFDEKFDDIYKYGSKVTRKMRREVCLRVSKGSSGSSASILEKEMFYECKKQKSA